MEADAPLLESLAVETSTEAKVTAQPTNLMITRSRSIIASFLLSFFLAVTLLFGSATFFIRDKIKIRVSSVYGPILKFIFDLDVRIQQDLTIFLLGLILGLVVLISTGHLTVKVIFLMPIVTMHLFLIPAMYAVAYEVYAVMVSGPSKLRSEMLHILGYGFIGFYAFISFVYFIVACVCYKKIYDEGREVPWIISAILTRTSKITNSSNLMSLMTKARYLPVNILLTCLVAWIVHDLVITSPWTFCVFPSYGGHGTVVNLTISGGIMISIILSIIAKSSQSFSNLGAIYCRNMYIYMVNAYFLFIFLTLIDFVGGLVQVSIGFNYVVGNEIAIFLTIVMICGCVYFKVTMSSVADSLRKSFSLPTIEHLTTDTLVDTGCESQSTNGRDTA